MDEQKRLQLEGFKDCYTWQDVPGTYYGPHKHHGITAHVILEGSMDITVDGKTTTYKKGDRFDVPAGKLHSARIGSDGCKYIVGEK